MCFSLSESPEHKKRASKATFLQIKLKYFSNIKVAHGNFSHKNLIFGHLLQVVMPKDFIKMFDSFQFHPILHCDQIAKLVTRWHYTRWSLWINVLVTEQLTFRRVWGVSFWQQLWPGESTGDQETVFASRRLYLWPGYCICDQETVFVTRFHNLWPGGPFTV